ncbi:MAG: citrate synthase, partial [Acidobacteria bacterium]|nr:citrate synthase [Acidobacteriota bacterium]
MSTSTKGLEGVTAAQSALSFIDGEAGRLIYRGYDIHDLAAHSTFEEVAYLMGNGRLPTRSQLDEFRQTLAAHRRLPDGLMAVLRIFPRHATPMEALRTAVSASSMFDQDADTISLEASRQKATRLTAQLPTIIAAFERLRNGQEPIPPRDDLDHAANYLYMQTGRVPEPEDARALDVYYILLTDHEMNASTFAARVATGTLSDMVSAITSAIGTLKGPLHGGANRAAMEMLLEIGEPDQAESYVRQALAEKKRIMGFGHRVYKTEDPRTAVLRPLSKQLCERAGVSKWYEISKRIEDLMIREKGINANVDFYSASVLYVLGIPIDLFTPMFACSRMIGWTAHV